MQERDFRLNNAAFLKDFMALLQDLDDIAAIDLVWLPTEERYRIGSLLEVASSALRNAMLIHTELAASIESGGLSAPAEARASTSLPERRLISILPRAMF